MMIVPISLIAVTGAHKLNMNNEKEASVNQLTPNSLESNSWLMFLYMSVLTWKAVMPSKPARERMSVHILSQNLSSKCGISGSPQIEMKSGFKSLCLKYEVNESTPPLKSIAVLLPPNWFEMTFSAEMLPEKEKLGRYLR